MIFGKTVLVPYKNEFSAQKNANENRSYPDYEYCISPIHMKSKSLSAITNYSIATKKLIDSDIEKGVLLQT